MSKRLYDTEIWKKPWFFDMPDKMKLFWFYLLSECNAAGIWTANFKIAKAYLGEIDQEKITELFRDQIFIINGGSYWLIKDYIKFQYGYPIKETSPMHRKLEELLTQRNLSLDTLYNTVYSTVSNTVCHTVKDKDKDIDIDKETKDRGSGGKKKEPPICEADLTPELKEEFPHVYRLARMVLENCPDVMTMDHPLSLHQLKELVKKHGVDPVEKIIKQMQNKGIKYLKQKHFHYAFLTIESWIR